MSSVSATQEGNEENKCAAKQLGFQLETDWGDALATWYWEE